MKWSTSTILLHPLHCIEAFGSVCILKGAEIKLAKLKWIWRVMQQFWMLASYFWFSGQFYVTWVHCIHQKPNHPTKNLPKFLWPFVYTRQRKLKKVKNSKKIIHFLEKTLTNAVNCCLFSLGLFDVGSSESLAKSKLLKWG